MMARLSAGSKLIGRRVQALDAMLASATVIAALLAGLVTATGLLSRFDRTLSDAWFVVSDAAPSGRVVIVDIARAAAERGDGLRLPRSLLAELLDRIDAAGAQRTLIDLSLPGRTTAADDAALADALRRLGPERVGLSLAAVAKTERDGTTRWGRIDPAPPFAAHAALVASDLAFDADGLLRRQGIAAAELRPLGAGSDWLAGEVPAGEVSAGEGARPIDFSLDARRIPVIDAVELLDGRAAAPRLDGRRIVLANSASALGAEIRVPRFATMRRHEITALATEAALGGRRLSAPSRLAATLAALALAVAAALWSARLGLLLGGCALGGFSLCLIATAASQQGAGLMLPAAAFEFAAILGCVAGQIARNPALRRVRESLVALVDGVDPRLGRVLDGAGEALVTFAPSGQILSMNAAARRLFEAAPGMQDTFLTDLLGTQADGLIAATQASRPGRLAATLDDGGSGHRHLDLTVNTMPADRGSWIGVATIRDVTDQRAQIDALRRAASQDPLTGLANRLRFEDVLAQACATMNAAAGEAGGVAVMLCDLDGFKAVNDTLGHQAGDTLLREIARRLAVTAEPGTTVARLGGDEFALVQSVAAVDVADLRRQAETLVSVVADPILIEGQPVRVGVSIGVAVGPEAGRSPSELVQVADAAMYRAKRTRSGVLVGAAVSGGTQVDPHEGAGEVARCA